MLCWAATVVVDVAVFQFFLISVFGTSPRRHFEFGTLVQARSFSREQATWRKSTNQSLVWSGVCFLWWWAKSGPYLGVQLHNVTNRFPVRQISNWEETKQDDKRMPSDVIRVTKIWPPRAVWSSAGQTSKGTTAVVCETDHKQSISVNRISSFQCVS